MAVRVDVGRLVVRMADEHRLPTAATTAATAAANAADTVADTSWFSATQREANTVRRQHATGTITRQHMAASAADTIIGTP